MEIILFTIVAAALYFGTDALLKYLEARRGQRFEQRSLIFFAIILVLAIITFEVLQRLLDQGAV